MGKNSDFSSAGKKLDELEAEVARVIEALEGLCMESVG